MTSRWRFGTLRRLPSKRWQATDAQGNAAPYGGTYGAEVEVAELSLMSAGHADKIDRARVILEAYFERQLGLTYSSVLRVPGSRWEYGR